MKQNRNTELQSRVTYKHHSHSYNLYVFVFLYTHSYEELYKYICGYLYGWRVTLVEIQDGWVHQLRLLTDTTWFHLLLSGLPEGKSCTCQPSPFFTRQLLQRLSMTRFGKSTGVVSRSPGHCMRSYPDWMQFNIIPRTCDYIHEKCKSGCGGGLCVMSPATWYWRCTDNVQG